MRKRLLDLLHEHDEEEVPKSMVVDGGDLERGYRAVESDGG